MRAHLIPLSLLLLLSHCTFTARSVKKETGFTFKYEGNTVIIGSKNTPKGGGDPYNIIVSESLNFKAIDYSQDTSIDDVVEGGLTLDQVLRPALILLGMGLGALALGLFRFKKKVS